MKCWAHEVPQAESLKTQAFRGVVTLRGDQQGIPDVFIAAKSVKNGTITSTKTDTKGRFEILGLNSGSYEVVSCLEGFNPWLGTVTVEQSAPAELHLQMTLGM